MRAIILFLAAMTLSAADFKGRWIFTVQGDPRGRAWWLKVDGKQGEFVGAPGGQLDAVTRMAVEGNELVWEVNKSHYRAHLEGAKLVGHYEVDGQTKATFTASRAPEIKDVDDGKWIKQKPVELFNGRDMTGWRVTLPDRSLSEWKVDGSTMKNGAGKAPDIASEQKFWNFDLHIEFRVAQHSNSGVGLRGRYEVQIYGDQGEPVSKHSNGALYSRIAPAVNATLPPGAWQVFDIRFIGREVTVKLNGKTLMEKRDVEGYTAMATDPNEDQPGPITLQGDHGPVEFRKVTVTSLVRGQ
jgi:hypothetical protein